MPSLYVSPAPLTPLTRPLEPSNYVHPWNRILIALSHMLLFDVFSVQSPHEFIVCQGKEMMKIVKKLPTLMSYSQPPCPTLEIWRMDGAAHSIQLVQSPMCSSNTYTGMTIGTGLYYRSTQQFDTRIFEPQLYLVQQPFCCLKHSYMYLITSKWSLSTMIISVMIIPRKQKPGIAALSI